MAITLNGDTGITTPTYGGSVTAEYSVPVTAFKNRIINGAMMIAQRGTSFTFANAAYPVDRFQAACFGTVPTATISQSTVAPTGFINSILLSITTGQAVSSTDIHAIRQTIEGFNLTDLSYGNASAVTTTLSFWVRSSLIGNYTVAILNPSSGKWYSQPYTVNAANTWEQKTITVVGDTASALATNNTTGLLIDWVVGAGSAYNGTASQTWNASSPRQITGSQNITTTTGATWQVTGVQLEKGSTATSFDYRPFGTELALCQRYCFVPNIGSGYMGLANTTTSCLPVVVFPVTMRATPTGTFSGTFSIDNGVVVLTFLGANANYNNLTVDMARPFFLSGSGGAFAASQAVNIAPGSTGQMIITAEL